MEWCREDILIFIDMYRKRELIWNPGHPEHYNKPAKQDAWEDIAKEAERPVDDCKKKMDSLLAALRREKMKIANSIRAGNSSNKLFKSQWFAFESMKFVLTKKPRHRNTTLYKREIDPDVTNDHNGNSDHDRNEVYYENCDYDENKDNYVYSDHDENKDHNGNSDTQVEEVEAEDKNTSPEKSQEGTSTLRTSFMRPSSCIGKQKTAREKRLDKAFVTLADLANQVNDDCFHFGNLVACRLRAFDKNVQCALQCDILKIFMRYPHTRYTSSPSSLESFR